MKERPILFSAPMVRAILEGRKTQTRRVIKLPPAPNHLGAWEPITVGGVGCVDSKGNRCPEMAAISHTRTGLTLGCRHGTTEERLWVRETFAMECCDGIAGHEPPYKDGRPILRHGPIFDGEMTLWKQAHYMATDPAPDLCCENERCRQCAENDFGPHWQPSIHMPKWASRILLEITDVRVQRLHDITEADAIAEGIQSHGDGHGFHVEEGRHYSADPIKSYASLWESINGARSWAANPWVWALSFKRVDGAA